MSGKKHSFSNSGESNDGDILQLETIRAAALFQETQLSLDHHHNTLRNLKKDIEINTESVCRLGKELNELNEEKETEAKEKTDAHDAHSTVTLTMERLVKDIDACTKRFHQCNVDVAEGEVKFKKDSVVIGRVLDDRKKASEKLRQSVLQAEAFPKQREEQTLALNKQQDEMMAEFEKLSMESINKKQTLEKEICLLGASLCELEKPAALKENEIKEQEEQIAGLKDDLESCGKEIKEQEQEISRLDLKISQFAEAFDRPTLEKELVFELEQQTTKEVDAKNILEAWVQEDALEREAIQQQIQQLKEQKVQIQLALISHNSSVDREPTPDVPIVEDNPAVEPMADDDLQLETLNRCSMDQEYGQKTPGVSQEDARMKMELLIKQNERLQQEMKQFKKNQLEIKTKGRIEALKSPEANNKPSCIEEQGTRIERRHRLLAKPTPNYAEYDEDDVLINSTKKCKKGRPSRKHKTASVRKCSEKKRGSKEIASRRSSYESDDSLDLSLVSSVVAAAPSNAPKASAKVTPCCGRTQGQPLANSTPFTSPDSANKHMHVKKENHDIVHWKNNLQALNQASPHPKRFFLSRIGLPAKEASQPSLSGHPFASKRTKWTDPYAFN